MAVQPAGIDVLPSELLIQILSSFPTRTLLPLTITSHRFHDVIIRILHNRLFAAASLQDHKLILECYHPSAKFSTPGLLCDYLSTDTITSRGGDIGRLGHLKSLYSHFRPTIPETEPRPRRRHPAGEAQVPDTAAEASTSSADKDTEKAKVEPPSQLITLESHELFSQLVTVANLVKVGPKRGLFLSCVTIGEGVMRVWRDWLGSLAVPKSTPVEFIVDMDDESKETRTLWLDRDRNIGVRLRVYEREDLNAAPVLRARDEDVTVVWEVVYEELFIRTTALLLKVEESLLQESNHSGQLCGIDGIYVEPIYLGHFGMGWPEVSSFLGGAR